MPKKQIDYIKLIGWMHRELKTPVPENLDKLSDFQLLNYADKLLFKLDCLPFTDNELDANLV